MPDNFGQYFIVRQFKKCSKEMWKDLFFFLLQHLKINNTFSSMFEPFCRLLDGFSLLSFVMHIYFSYLCEILKIIHYSIEFVFVCNLQKSFPYAANKLFPVFFILALFCTFRKLLNKTMLLYFNITEISTAIPKFYDCVKYMRISFPVS